MIKENFWETFKHGKLAICVHDKTQLTEFIKMCEQQNIRGWNNNTQQINRMISAHPKDLAIEYRYNSLGWCNEKYFINEGYRIMHYNDIFINDNDIILGFH